jgi:hypothetical protein
MDAVADGRIERPLTAWHCCLEFYSVTTRLPEEYRLEPETALRLLREEIFPRFSIHDLQPELREEFLVPRSTLGRPSRISRSLLHLLQSSPQCLNERRQAVLNCGPEDVQVDVKIGMDQPVTHADNIGPGDFIDL